MVHTPAIAKQRKLPIPALLVAAHTTKQAKQRKRLKEKKESRIEKKRKESGKCGDVGRREGIANCKMHRDLANTTCSRPTNIIAVNSLSRGSLHVSTES